MSFYYDDENSIPLQDRPFHRPGQQSGPSDGIGNSQTYYSDYADHEHLPASRGVRESTLTAADFQDRALPRLPHEQYRPHDREYLPPLPTDADGPAHPPAPPPKDFYYLNGPYDEETAGQGVLVNGDFDFDDTTRLNNMSHDQSKLFYNMHASHPAQDEDDDDDDGEGYEYTDEVDEDGRVGTRRRRGRGGPGRRGKRGGGGAIGSSGNRFGGRGRAWARKLQKVNWKKQPYFIWLVSIIQVGVFIAELAKMGKLTGSPIQTQPSFNPMIGPSSYVMINMGARFTPCMHFVANVTNGTDLSFPCPNSTDTSTNVCSLSELCGMGGVPTPPKRPDQWWRFIVPIFIHAGFVHIGFNLLLQLKLGAELEKEIGLVRIVIVYFSSGIAGFVLGGNFTPDGIASTGASGSIFGVIALDLLDLLFNWSLYASPKRNLAIHIAEIIISFVLGLLPGLDNFSHIGGFAMGLLVGTAVLRSPLSIRARSGFTVNPETSARDNAKLRPAEFNWRHPSDHFRGRKKWWYAWVIVRGLCIATAVVYFVTLIRRFETGGGTCSWCKYLSCLPVKDWCDQGDITTS